MKNFTEQVELIKFTAGTMALALLVISVLYTVGNMLGVFPFMIAFVMVLGGLCYAAVNVVGIDDVEEA